MVLLMMLFISHDPDTNAMASCHTNADATDLISRKTDAAPHFDCS